MLGRLHAYYLSKGPRAAKRARPIYLVSEAGVWHNSLFAVSQKDIGQFMMQQCKVQLKDLLGTLQLQSFAEESMHKRCARVCPGV